MLRVFKRNKDIQNMKPSLWRDAWIRLRRNKLAMAALIVIILLILAVILADVITPYNFAKQNVREKFLPPSWQHWFGTDNFGRDLFTRVLKGGQTSLAVAVFSVLVSMFLGTLLGATAAYFKGVYGGFIMRFMDVLMGIPPLLLAVCISAALGSGLVNTVIAVALSTMPSFVRTMYAQVLAETDKEYIEAATACGAKGFSKIFAHIIPNSLAPIIVTATLRLGTAIIMISSLSFIGLGVQPPTPEWGSIMSNGKEFIRSFWPMVTFPGIFICITMVAFNILGDGLRDALDPRLR